MTFVNSHFGFVVIDKPKGLTSHDCVKELRRIFGIKRIGHGGTLDPSVTGVLPIALGSATRLIPYLKKSKTYIVPAPAPPQFCTLNQLAPLARLAALLAWAFGREVALLSPVMASVAAGVAQGELMHGGGVGREVGSRGRGGGEER